MVWQPVVEQRAHPLGEAGVRSSLDEVAKHATYIYRDGVAFSRVKAWAGKKLHAAKVAGRAPDTNRARADVLLTTIQREKLWVPDPVGMEYVVGPHMMACDRDEDNPEGVCIQSEDCDSLTVLLAACCMAVGLHVVIVAHGYDKAHPANRRLQHVLCKIMMDDGTWAYADPSYDFPLGSCHPFTRERVISLPDARVLCDAESCDVSGFNPDMPYMQSGGGVYMGLSGAIGVGRVLLPPPPEIGFVHPVSFLGQGEEEPGAGEAAWTAFADEAAARNYGTSDEDLEAYGATAGAAGGAAACVAVGAAAAAPLCGYVGGKVGGWVVSLFTGSSEEEERRRRQQAAAWNQYEQAEKEARELFSKGWRSIVGDFNQALRYGSPPPSYVSDLASPFPPLKSKKVKTLQQAAEALKDLQAKKEYQQALSDYYAGDTGVMLTEDVMYQGLDGPTGSVVWRMVRMFGYPKGISIPSDLIANIPLPSGGWGGDKGPEADDWIDLRDNFLKIQDAIGDWVARSIYCGGTLEQVKAGQCPGTKSAEYVTSGAWKERIPLAQERLKKALDEFSRALSAAASPQIAQAAAIRASRQNPPKKSSAGAIVIGGVVAVGIAWATGLI